MAIEVRELDTMIEDTLDRIVDADIGITNTSVGSVVRTIVEAIMSEIDVSNYGILQAYGSKVIDDSEDEDLDNIGTIFGVVRDPATNAIGTVTFSTTEASDEDIHIEYGYVISTQQSASGDVYEAIITDENLYLPAGQLSVVANVELSEPGSVYLPIGSLCVMTTSIVGISNVSNTVVISGGSDVETDESLRYRIKNALSKLGKGTLNALKTALEELDAVTDVAIIDMPNGVGTVDAVVVTDIIPPSAEIDTLIKDTVASTKSAGVFVNVVYPTIVPVDISVTTTTGDNTVIRDAIVSYVNSLGISDPFIIKQMESDILIAINDKSADATTITPTSNVTITGTQVIKVGTITVNGVVL